MRANQWPLLVTLILGISGTASALQVEGPAVETGSWTQAFTEFGSGNFDHIQLRTLSGDGFVMGLDGIGVFSDGAWCQSYNDGTIVTADGPTESFLGFTLHFAGDLVDPLSFDYQIWDGAVLQASLLVTWSGSSFSVGPSSWSDGRIDQGQDQFTGAFDVSQVGLAPGCMAEAQYTVSLGQLCASGPASAPDYFHYTVFVDYPASLQPTAVQQIYFPGGGHTFQVSPLSGGQLEISMTLFSAVTNHTGPLFRVLFDAIADLPPNEVFISEVVLRKPVNTNLVAWFGPGDDLLIDAVLPTITLDDVPELTCQTDAGFTVDLSATDPVGLSAIEWRLDSDPWQDTLLPVSGTSYGPVPFFVDLTGVADGAHTVEFRSVDASCNASPLADWAFFVDNTLPEPVNSLLAQPRDHAVLLSWAATSGHDGYSIYRVKRPTYPYPYAPGLTPQLSPVDSVTSVGPAVTSWLDDFGSDDFATRGVYDYRLVAFDCANGTVNGSIASATNYFLGDWAMPYSGTVCGDDLGLMSMYYNTPTVPASSELDVAPTSDFTAFGLPMPDGQIGFEDLVIFAINYRVGCASPLTTFPGSRPCKDALVASSGTVELAQTGNTVRLHLDSQVLAASLDLRGQGRYVSARCDQGVVFVTPSASGWTVDAAHLNPDDAHGLDIVLTIADASALELVSADCRDARNALLDLNLETGGASLPTSLALLPNVPNPFNPSTLVRFVLPETQSVSVDVFNLQGARVLTLLDGELPAGEHTVRFDATGLASGVYVTRLQAGPRVLTQKMLLLR